MGQGDADFYSRGAIGARLRVQIRVVEAFTKLRRISSEGGEGLEMFRMMAALAQIGDVLVRRIQLHVFDLMLVDVDVFGVSEGGQSNGRDVSATDFGLNGNESS